MSFLSIDILKSIPDSINTPLVLHQFVINWTMCQWDLDKWCSVIGEKEIPFRSMRKDFISDEPCWERKCYVKTMKFRDFVRAHSTSEDWMYFDYKYLHQWFNGDNDLCKEISWSQFGYPNKGSGDTTLWIGSDGAHTPVHQDTYGVNIVAQLYGKKRWILFPPDTPGLKATRVPYEESSIYSELNFYCPNNLSEFKGLTGGFMVELSKGDALIVPRGWWHFVQNVAPISIAVNTWMPHESDFSTRVSEALIKIFIAQICKDMPLETRKLLLNPNEDDIVDTPLAVLFLELETVAKAYLDNRRKLRRAKRQKTSDEDNHISNEAISYDLEALIKNKVNNLHLPRSLDSDSIVSLLKDNIKRYTTKDRVLAEDETDSTTASLELTKALIDSYSDSNVIEAVKHNLFAKLSQY